MGTDVLKIIFAKFQQINQQKVRVDQYVKLINGAPKVNADEIRKHLNRTDIFPLIQQQQYLPWLKNNKNYKYIIMDSFSELTDQEFVHIKDGWSFYCHYNDLIHSEDFKNEFLCNGLLGIEKIEFYYDLYFDNIFKKFPNKKVIFIHFPTCLDKRQLYKDRGEVIKIAIEKLKGKYPNIISISIPDQFVLQHENDDFPYHYGKETYMHFVNELNKQISK